jgi:CheY-like chemotaxis protein
MSTPAVVGALPSPRPAPPRPWVILLVDDEPDVLVSLQQIIETSLPGTRVLPVNSGRKALDLLSAERIDVILTDFKMPGMDGIEFLYQARKAYPHIPRLMLTAFADDDLVRRAIADSFVDAFIPKMIAPEDLLSRVAKFLHYDPSMRPSLGAAAIVP